MERQRVSSSDLAFVGYDENSATLEIEFHNRTVYQYFNVPVLIYTNLMAASSKGRYFNENIRNDYSCRKVA